MDIQEEGLLKYTVQNHLEKNYFDTSCYCRSSKAGGIAAFIDAEHAFDRNYAEKLGLILKPNHFSTGQWTSIRNTENLIRSGAIDIVVIDSVAALTPKE
jgi:RecA/RadA recombinase